MIVKAFLERGACCFLDQKVRKRLHVCPVLACIADFVCYKLMWIHINLIFAERLNLKRSHHMKHSVATTSKYNESPEEDHCLQILRHLVL